jgi:precorrin-2 dehydrogenase / sirohydrochlorin ferrochelatase
VGTASDADPATPLGAARLYPAFLDLTDRLAVVVGGGPRAARKVRTLLACGARVRLVTPEDLPELEAMAEEGRLTHERRGYVRGDLDGALAAVAVSGSDETDRAVAEEAAERGCLVSASGAPELSNFRAASTVRRGALQIAVSTSGVAPEVARTVRRDLAERYGPEWAAYLALVSRLRDLVIERVPFEGKRQAMLDAIASSDLIDRVRAGQDLDLDHVYLEFFRSTELHAPDERSDTGNGSGDG